MSYPQTESTGVSIRELTIRGIAIDGMIIIIFTAANVYLGLKVGLTFMTSIPAAVISMAILRYFKDHNVQENNVIQTIASVAGTLSAIIFILPGPVMIGWWQDFPYWQSVAVITSGGVLGVMYSIPLRRTLVTHSDLLHPEGVAAAEALQIGDSTEGEEESRWGLFAIIKGVVASSGLAILSSAKVVGTKIGTVFTVGAGGTMASASLSLALLGVGHLVGIVIGIAMIVGLLTPYGVFLPMRSRGLADDPVSASESVSMIFRSEARFISAGAIAVATVWTLLKLLAPIIGGIRDSPASSSKRASGEVLPPSEQDPSGKAVIGVTTGPMLPTGALLWPFLKDTPSVYHWVGLVLASILFVLIAGLAAISVCGYMAGLIDAPNSPISGVDIPVAVAVAPVVRAVHGTIIGDELSVLVAYTFLTAALAFGIVTISNGNLQDLETGQFVEAIPWKQQLAPAIDVGFGAVITPPVLSLMHRVFGFQGVPGTRQSVLAAPQVPLISGLIRGVFGGDLNWGLLRTGALIGMIVIIIDGVFKRATKRLSLPGLAAGMDMYLPMAITIVVPTGALLGLLHGQWTERQVDSEKVKRMGTLVVTGLIIGESFWGVVYAGIVGFSGKDTPLALFGEFSAIPVQQIGTILFVAAAIYLYKDMRSKAKVH